jgi:hypothetical protein
MNKLNKFVHLSVLIFLSTLKKQTSGFFELCVYKCINIYNTQTQTTIITRDVWYMYMYVCINYAKIILYIQLFFSFVLAQHF